MIIDESIAPEYSKIQSVFKRDENTHRFIENKFSLPEFDYLKKNNWWMTEKVHGTNTRVAWDGRMVRFAGKTNDAQISQKLFWKLQETFTNKKFCGLYPDTPMCLYGESYGASINSGGNYIRGGVDFVLFDVLIDGWWLRREGIEDVANKLDIDFVPLVGKTTLLDAVEMIRRKTLKSCWGDFLAEGVVLKPEVEMKTRRGDRIITKLKHKDFRRDNKRNV